MESERLAGHQQDNVYTNTSGIRIYVFYRKMLKVDPIWVFSNYGAVNAVGGQISESIF